MDEDMMDDGGHHEQEAMLEESYERHKGYTQNSDDDQRVRYRELDGRESPNNSNNNSNNNSRENSNGYESQEEQIRVPSEPPVKPPNVTQYYVESRRIEAQSEFPDMSNTEIDQMLREQYKELGKNESQAVKRKVKELKRTFEQELQLYKQHNPSFDDKKWYGETSKSNKNKNKKKGGSRKKRGKSGTGGSDSDGIGGGGGSGYTRRRNEPKSFLMNSFEEADSDDDFGEPASKRRRKNRSGNNNSNSNSNDNNNDENTMDQFFASIVKSKSGGKRRKREDGENIVIDDEVLSSMRDLCDQMREASAKDWLCNQRKMPATHTTQLVGYVSQQLNKKALQQTFIEDERCYVLDCIRDWIHPLPDGSLPPIKVRSEMYRIIHEFELQNLASCRDYLERSNERSAEDEQEDLMDNSNDNSNGNFRRSKEGFPKTLMNLWAHKDETLENKRRLRGIILRLIHQLTQGLREPEELDAERQKEDVRRRNEILKKQSRNYTLASINDGERKRAAIPERPGFDFAIKPKSQVGPVDDSKGSMMTRREIFEKRFSSKTTAKNNQAMRPSVTGRRR